MLRSIELIFLNEFRLQIRDRASLFMLLVAPVVIIAVAGFSLGNLFGTRAPHEPFSLVVIDQDHGRVAAAIIDALAHEPYCKLLMMPDVEAARRFVLDNARAPFALVIPPNLTAAFASGQTAKIEVLIDPVKRLQASAIELRLNELSQALMITSAAKVRNQFIQSMADLRAHIEEAGTQSRALEVAMRDYRHQLMRRQKAAEEELQNKIQHELDALRAESQASMAQAIAVTRQSLDRSFAARRASMLRIEEYLKALNGSAAEFDRWFAQLKTMAGSRAAQIPPPPRLPSPPTSQQLAELTRPLSISIPQLQLPSLKIANLKLPISGLPTLPRFSFDFPKILTAAVSFPGAIAWEDKSITPGRAEVSAFEQYVPGFGITFLLIDMLWGMSVALMDERQWGTLQRLRISGASVAGMLIGRLSARTLIGFVQMIVLFGAGWVLFDIKLGVDPTMLLSPAAAIAFAAAAFGLLIATLTPTRDSAIPIGAVAAMVMSAVGGCWWPLEFEPAWMRTAALTVPTTWTMHAFNDLMIRNLAPSTALWPSTISLGIGVVFLLGGIAGAGRLYR